jgi:ABC-2 type transport system permease protein
MTLAGTRKYVSLSRASLEVILAYRAGFAMNVIGTVFYVVAMFYLWQTIFAANNSGLGGFTWDEMKAYLLVGFLMNSLMTWYDEYFIGQGIREGEVAIDLIRPIDFQATRLAMAIGPIPTELAIALVVAVAVDLAFGGIALPPQPVYALVFLVSAALGTMIKFGLIFCVAMAAFWTTGLYGLTTGRIAVQSIFSGALIPLTFFPGWLQSIAAILPFQGTVSTPALIFLGKMDGPTMAVMLAIQAAWAVGLIILGRLIFRRAVKAVTIHGG